MGQIPTAWWPMKSRVVPVPGPMLLDRRLAESAKLVWMYLEAQAPAPTVLASRSGLSRQTVQRGLAQLQSTGWLPAPTACAQGAATSVADVPGDLLFDHRPGFRAQVLYAYLKLTPDWHGQPGVTTRLFFTASSTHCTEITMPLQCPYMEVV